MKISICMRMCVCYRNCLLFWLLLNEFCLIVKKKKTDLFCKETKLLFGVYFYRGIYIFFFHEALSMF